MIKIYSPASIGNINVGFDTLGIAISPINNDLLGDYISIKKSKNFEINNTGKFSNQLPINIKDNITWHAWKFFCKILGKKIPIKINLEKNMPIGSGLGSSASSIVCSVLALNKFYQTNFSKKKLLELMGILEGKLSGSIHYDNVSPCYLGGLQLIIEKKTIISQNLPIFNHWFWIISWPGINLSTKESRKVLPKFYTQKICIQHGKNLSTFIHALHTNQPKLAIEVMNDIIAEPYREKIIPNFSYTKKNILKLGALNCGISGSGPSIFAICDTLYIAKKIQKWLKENYIQNNNGFSYICKVDNIGAQEIGIK